MDAAYPIVLKLKNSILKPGLYTQATVAPNLHSNNNNNNNTS